MVAFYLNHPDRAAKGQPVSIYGRVSLSKTEAFDLPTRKIRIKILPEYWDQAKRRASGRHPNAAWINAHLAKIEKQITDLYLHNLDKSWAEFKSLVLGVPPEEKKSLLVLYDEFLGSRKTEVTQGTLNGYAVVRKHLENFADLTPETLDWKFTERFKAHLFGRNLQDTTVTLYMSKLREFGKWLKKTGHNVHAAYSEWELSIRKKPPIPLLLDELDRFQNFILPEKESIARDYMCLEARIAARISNVQKFDITQVIDSIWSYRQKKGNTIRARQVSIDFTWWYIAKGLDIIARYKEGKLPAWTAYKIDKVVKKAGKLAGLNRMVTVEKWENGQCELIEVPLWKTLSTHTGRATFITNGLQFLPAKLVKDMAGIESWATLKHYEGPTDANILRKQVLADNLKNQMKAS